MKVFIVSSKCDSSHGVPQSIELKRRDYKLNTTLARALFDLELHLEGIHRGRLVLGFQSLLLTADDLGPSESINRCPHVCL